MEQLTGPADYTRQQFYPTTLWHALSLWRLVGLGNTPNIDADQTLRAHYIPFILHTYRTRWLISLFGRLPMSASLVNFSTRFPRLLIAENNFSASEPLIRTFGDRRLVINFDVCTTHGNAVRSLLASPYQLIISGAHLAELDDFSLLKRAQAVQPFVPFLVTASPSEKEAARRVLAQGAFDLLPSPLDHEQTVRTIRLALWHGKLRTLIAQKEAALEQYRQHMADYPADTEKLEESFQRTLLAFEKTISSVARTIVRVEESSLCFSDFATKVEYQIRKRALERLDHMSNQRATAFVRRTRENRC